MLKGCNIMARRKEFDPTKQEQALKLYEQATPSTSVRLKNGKIGIITDKFLSDEGIPHFWVQEIGAADPTPEPVEQVEATEELWIYRLKTKRDNHDPIAVVLFAGGGGVEAGMVAAGIEPILAVEYDPDKPELSEALAASHEANFPRCKVLRRTVSEFAADDFPGFPQEPDILWVSPVCSNFSAAKNGEEQIEDVLAAKAVVQAIAAMSPKHFLLENVTGYASSVSWGGLKESIPQVEINQLNPNLFLSLISRPVVIKAYAIFALGFWVFRAVQEPDHKPWRGIEAHIKQLGYQVDSSAVNMSDYGVPQARVRFIVRACREGNCREGNPLPLPEKQPKISWYDAIADLIPKLPESQLLKGQQKEVDEFLKSNPPTPLLINRSGGRGRYRAVPSTRPANTIMRSHFTDGKNANRTKFADIWLPDGTVKSVSIECIRRLQSFPDWYQLPEQIGVAGSILGYSVPPKFVELLLAPLASCTDNHQIAFKPSDTHYKVQTSNGLNGGSQIESGSYTGLSIAEIRRDGATQPREKLDLNHIATLKEAIEDGAELDPVIVFYDGSNYWLADGFHRCKASEESEMEDIHCVIHQGTRRDAILYSVGANAEHKAAKPRSRADKRRAVRMLLSDPEWSKWSDSSIARQCKVTHPFVASQRKKLTCNITSENTRTYKTKHGTTATMQTGNIGKKDEKSESNTSAPPIKGEELTAADGNGNGEMEIDKTKPAIDPNDYAIAFMTNIDHINPDLLKVARQRIDERLAAIDKPSP
jgi:DNA (cytosine-5)-methyltransferase 1